MPKKENSKYAENHHCSDYAHRNLSYDRIAAAFEDFRHDLKKAMSKPGTKIDNGPGTKKTIFKNENFRYGREKDVPSASKHSHSRYTNYSIQANLEADHPHVKSLAKNSNGASRAPKIVDPKLGKTFGRSTVSSVNIQCYKGKMPSPTRVSCAQQHSAICANPLYVETRVLQTEADRGLIANENETSIVKVFRCELVTIWAKPL